MSDVSLLIIVLLAVALLLQIDFVFYIVYVVAGIYLWSRWYTPRAFRKIELGREFTDHAFLGEEIRVILHVHNEGRLPVPWLQISESVAPELAVGTLPNFVVFVGGKDKTTFEYRIRPTRRGYYRVGPARLRAGDLFGWSEQRGKSHPSYLTVYPRITPLSHLGLRSRLPFGTIASRQRLFEDPSRPAGVRDYRSGDEQRQINWKVSAHHDRLVVKTLQPAISLDTSILLNLDHEDYARRLRYSAPEWAIQVAASLAAHLIARQQAVGLATTGSDPLLERDANRQTEAAFDQATGRLVLSTESEGQELASTLPDPIPLRRGKAHLMKILELLARVEADRTISFLDWIPGACLNLGWGTTVLAITPVGDEKTCQSLNRLVRAGLNPVLILIKPTHRFGEIRERARRLGFSAYHVPETKGLDVWRQPQFSGVR